MGTTTLLKGQNAPLDQGEHLAVTTSVRWRAGGVGDVDVIALLTGADRRVRSSDDMIFYNQRSSADGSAVHSGKVVGDAGGSDGIVLDLGAVAADVHAVVLAASTDGQSFGEFDELEWRTSDADGTPLASFTVPGLSTERAVVLGEIYRRDGCWRVRAVGQGWDGGLAGLATDYGVDVSDADPEASSTEANGAGQDADLIGDDPEVAEDSLTVDDGIASSGVVRDVGRSILAEASAEPADAGGAQSTVTVESSVVVREVTASAGQPVRVRETSRKLTVSRSSSRPRAALPVPVLAGAPSWQPSRLFSISGVGGVDEQEKRATSALMWVIQAVRPLGRAITARAGGPAGPIETYLEVPFQLGEQRFIPDAVVRISRGNRIWTALIEVKTGGADLRREQVEAYLRIARREKFDAVLTISNEITSDADIHPVEVTTAMTKGVRLVHLSWSEIMHDIRMLLAHHDFEQQLSMWILSELQRYLQHPRSGTVSFNDMGPAWVQVREAVAAGTLGAGDRKTAPVVTSWNRLIRHVCLRLTASLGIPVKQVLPRRLKIDPVLRDEEIARRLADDGALTATIRIPDAAGPVTVTADLRTTQIQLAMDVPAPAEGNATKKVRWLTGQLRQIDTDVTLECHFAGRPDTTRELLSDVRERPSRLLPVSDWEPATFIVRRRYPMGTKRAGTAGSFVSSVLAALDDFYEVVVQRIRPPEPAQTAATAATKALTSSM